MKQDSTYLSLLRPYELKHGASPHTKFLRSFYPDLSAEACQYIDQNCYTLKLKKNQQLLKAGQKCSYLFLINAGILRAYIQQGKKEITTWIVDEHSLITSIESFYNQTVAVENIAAVEDCELSAIDYNTLQYLYNKFPELNYVGRIILEQYYIDADKRAYISRLTRASEKYKHFVETKEELSNRVPLKYIASYLNMTLETLSRVRSGYRNKSSF
ncbi:Crp/Fnr family transcriptional regulator [Ferruginibacter albus]|uniref:Crp/Fnr family transcriptional regulator n=1 Tax=Ferruginibacter albus TaxID=2875540 RepID=UPI001CC56E38|nr:Crp/Fnr family transcriptional regulator [Ferruginibacter albus]UAY53261.1 Crp/Fnr family transcriptional regulator [Ferruginibacter albus]